MNDYDESNKETLLEGGQLEMLRSFFTMKEREQITNVGGIYYLFSKYWPKNLAEELRKTIKVENANYSLDDTQIIEKNKPLQYFSSDVFDWNGIKETIDILEATRKSVIRGSKKKWFHK